ncbi:LysR substrate-binding domain-containing protein [Sphingobium sp. Sx8-8]|uniref:LysR substrate-binding domain-containing protein n=1 Tax=Sphingobium sp. Sx8-8 TaxID=2933617 RepID=UPI001F59BF78|nr:LysR substrate-binding domain-containing protein [Sphingobium sp. Sx8-8]
MSAMLAKAAAAGMGIAYVERREAQPFLDGRALVRVLADWTPPYDSEALYHPRQRLRQPRSGPSSIM